MNKEVVMTTILAGGKSLECEASQVTVLYPFLTNFPDKHIMTLLIPILRDERAG